MFKALNFITVFRGSTYNLENFACEHFQIIMHIAHDIYGIPENCFREIYKNCKSLKMWCYTVYSVKVYAHQLHIMYCDKERPLAVQRLLREVNHTANLRQEI